MSRNSVQRLAHLALLIALQIILSRFLSINTPIVRIGFGFVPIVLCAILYGPVWAGVVGGLSDFLGAILFPSGAYFIGFTISAILTGVIYGLFLYKHTATPVRILGAVATDSICISLGLSTLWLAYIMNSPYLTILVPRIAQNVILIPIEFVLIGLMKKPVERYLKIAKKATL